ncbi:MAG: iron ABC transporter permease [Paludibacteraceae bacterium]|nr:iron ABC transporter permease [Paludibacteraceae bacterium]
MNKAASNIVIFSLLTIALLITSAADVIFGSVNIGLDSIIDSLTSANNGIEHEIIMNIRLPKMLTAILSGAGLGVAGLMMQTMFRNPLAGPYILGISSGATLGVSIVIMLGTFLGISMFNHWLTIGAAVAGALIILLLVLAVSKYVKSNVSLLIIGMMIGNIATSVVGIIQNYSNPDALKLFILWTYGSLDSVNWHELYILACVISLGLMIAIFELKSLNAMLLGEMYAGSMGVNIKRSRIAIILSTGLLAGGVTAFVGPIAFVGVAVPHIARGFMKSANHRLLIPATALIGSTLVLCCDIISHLFTHSIPISTISALVGAPIIIYILLKGE